MSSAESAANSPARREQGSGMSLSPSRVDKVRCSRAVRVERAATTGSRLRDWRSVRCIGDWRCGPPGGVAAVGDPVGLALAVCA